MPGELVVVVADVVVEEPSGAAGAPLMSANVMVACVLVVGSGEVVALFFELEP